MKKNGKKLSMLFFMCLLFSFMLPWMTKQTEAAEKKQVMTLNIKDKYKTTSTPIYAVPYGNGYTYFELENRTFAILKDQKTDIVQVSVTVHDSRIILPESLKYNKTVALSNTSSSQEISFSYKEGDAVNNSYLYYYMEPYEVNLKIESLAVAASSKGFYPSKGNYLPINSVVSAQIGYGTEGTTSLRLRIVNSKKRYVYQKSFRLNGSGSAALNYRWNGKASKNNTARVKAGSYVKSGSYRVELTLAYNYNGYKKEVTRSKKLTISKKAPKGTKGVAKAKQVPMLTGYANIDYMAELMVKAAGVRSGMSQDQKVKRIYHYMTKNFKHVHYDEKQPKVRYNLKKLRPKINAYKRKTDSLMRRDKMSYTYFGAYQEWTMQRRAGVCDDNAAAFKILCNHVGIEADVVSGYYKNRNGSLAGHSWNSAVVNGKTYYYDVDVEIQNYKGGQGDYYWYKKTKSQAKKNHVF